MSHASRAFVARARWLAVIAFFVLFLSACGGEDDPAAAPSPTPSPDGQTTATGDVPADAAATVDGTDIPRARVEEQFEAATNDPAVSEQLEAEEGDELTTQLRAGILSQLIVTEIVRQAGEEEGIEVTQEDRDAARADVVEQMGGQESFDQAIAMSGMSEEALEQQLHVAAILSEVERRASEDLPAASPTPTDGASPDQRVQMAVQQWVVERLGAADVAVDPEYGTWDPATGQVTTGPPPDAGPLSPAPGATPTEPAG